MDRCDYGLERSDDFVGCGTEACSPRTGMGVVCPADCRAHGELHNSLGKRDGSIASIGIRTNEAHVNHATAVVSGDQLVVNQNHVVVPHVGHGEVVILNSE